MQCCPICNGMDFDVIIVGGGLTGCTLALALHSGGLKVALVDAQKPQVHLKNDFDGRSYALSAASKMMLDALNLWPDLDRNAQPMLDIKVTDGRAGQAPSPLMMHFDHRDLGSGPMGYLVEDRYMRQVLLAAVHNAGITHLCDTTVISQQTDDVAARVTLSTGETLTAALLVGADGRASGTADRAGIQRIVHDYHQSSLVCAIAHEHPHNGVAHQFFMPSGPLAILPLTGNRSSIVWTETTDAAVAINALSDKDYLSVLRPRFGEFLGKIELAGQRYTYPLGRTLTYDMIATPRVALAGDAAHGVHPIAGQGLNAGFKDIAALAEVLCNAKRRGQDIGTSVTLNDYQQWRRTDNTTLGVATHGFNALFSNDSPMLRGLRDVGMGMINTWPGARKIFMRQAAGLTDRRPKLLQGRSL